MPTFKTSGLLLLTTLLCGCAGEPTVAPVEDRGLRAPLAPRLIDPHRRASAPGAITTLTRYRVRGGDTLHGIAWRFGLDVHRLASWNSLRDPFLIYPDQVLLLKPPADPAQTIADTRSKPAGRPSPAPKSSRTIRRARSAAAPPEIGKAPQATVVVAPPKAERTPEPAPSPARNLTWRWPTPGPLLARFSARTDGRKGIEVGGRFGQPVLAAADGRVVYAGSKLLGYGKLVIVEHDDTLLSAYGNNRTLLVGEGDAVKVGQKIAEMGTGKLDRPSLHFEIRRNGDPVDPLDFVSPEK